MEVQAVGLDASGPAKGEIPEAGRQFILDVSKVCHMHNLPADYLCETCEELCCEMCFFQGSHANPVTDGSNSGAHWTTDSQYNQGTSREDEA